MNTGDVGGDQQVPIGYVDSVQRDDWAQPERAVFHSRDGHKVYVRAVDPCDPEPQRIPVFEGDQVIVMQHFSHISHHTTEEDVSIKLASTFAPLSIAESLLTQQRAPVLTAIETQRNIGFYGECGARLVRQRGAPMSFAHLQRESEHQLTRWGSS